MMPEITIPVAVRIPGVGKKERREAFDFFMAAWEAGGKRPFNGEYELQNVDNKAPQRGMTVDFSNISHVVTDILKDTYDPKMETVCMKLRFAGPKGAAAMEDYCISKNARLAARTVRVRDKRDGTVKSRIVTWDLIHEPQKDMIDKAAKYGHEFK